MITKIAFLIASNSRKILLAFLVGGVFVVCLFEILMILSVANSGIQFMDNMGGMVGNIGNDLTKYQNFGNSLNNLQGGFNDGNNMFKDLDYKSGYDLFNVTFNNTISMFEMKDLV